MLAAQTTAELKLVLRNGEQVLLSLVIPLGLVVLLVTVPFITLDGTPDAERADFFVPGVLALAVMSAAFTGQAIAVGFERLCAVGLALGWDPQGSPLSVLALVVVGTAAFSGLGLLLGGTMRGLTTLAAANLLWFVLLVLGGVLFPLSAFGPAEPVLALLPTAALATGLREVLQDGAAPLRELAVLAVWALVSLTAASRAFRWE
jgi:ABC-2 type transport system permease protein